MKITRAIHGRTLRGAELLQAWNHIVHPSSSEDAPEYIVAYSITGEGRLTANQTTYRFFANSGFIIQTNQTTGIEASPTSPHFDIYIIGIKDINIDLQQMLSPSDQPKSPMFRIGTERRMLFEETAQKAASPSRNMQKSASLLLGSFLYEMADQRNVNGNTPINRHVEKALERMHANIGQELSMENLCLHLEISQSHLSRLFQEAFGVSPKAYLSKLRMDAARSLLAETELPIQDIAERMGYLNPFSFSRAFTQITGQSPSAYRNQAKASSERQDPQSADPQVTTV